MLPAMLARSCSCSTGGSSGRGNWGIVVVVWGELTQYLWKPASAKDTVMLEVSRLHIHTLRSSDMCEELWPSQMPDVQKLRSNVFSFPTLIPKEKSSLVFTVWMPLKLIQDFYLGSQQYKWESDMLREATPLWEKVCSLLLIVVYIVWELFLTSFPY